MAKKWPRLRGRTRHPTDMAQKAIEDAAEVERRRHKEMLDHAAAAFESAGFRVRRIERRSESHEETNG